MSSPGPRQLRVVALGGGTGLSTLLRGLKRYVATPGIPTGHERRADRRHQPAIPQLTERRVLPDVAPDNLPCLISELSAIVTVTDDGGSSGRLREELNMLPPGDVRNCMVALSEDEHLLSRLFQYRFQHGDLQGHSFGNLFLAALSAVTGDFAQAVQTSSQILATRGRIYPSTTANATLAAQMVDGSIVRGETNITASKQTIAELMLDPPDAPPLPETLKAIAAADLITIGPGSLYTSLITNLLVHGIPEALAASSATRVFVCNLMTQANESLGLTASQHIEKILDHARARIFDYAVINTAPILPATLQQYAASGQAPIEADLERVRSLGVEPITGNFLHEGEVLRHGYDQVAEVILHLALKAQRCSMAVHMARKRSSSLKMPRAFFGRIFLAVAMLGFGGRYAYDGHLSAGAPPLPPFLPFGGALSIIMAILLVAAGLALMTPWHLRDSTLTLAGLLLFSACLHLIHLGAVLHEGDARTGFLEPLALGTAAFVLYGLAHHPERLYLFIAARSLFAFTMITFGAQHFMYTGFIANLIPAWIPYHVDWVYATGGAMIAVGLAMISGIMARPATIALAVMFFAWLVVLHIPLIVASPKDADKWSSAFVVIGMCGASLLMSTSPRLPALRHDLALETYS